MLICVLLFVDDESVDHIGVGRALWWTLVIIPYRYGDWAVVNDTKYTEGRARAL